MKGLGLNTVDRSRYINDAWAALKKKCGHYNGVDSGGRGLCSHEGNSSDVEQERDCVRCGLPWCAYKSVVDKTVKKTIARNNRDNQKHLIPVMHNATPLTQREPAKVIDISGFVSPDAEAYAKESARV